MSIRSLRAAALLGFVISLSACGGGGGGDATGTNNPGTPAPTDDSRVNAHYVKLVTTGDQPAFLRQDTIDRYNTCATAFSLRGAPGAPEPLGELPAIVNPTVREEYHTAHRAITFLHLESIKFTDTCGKLIEQENKMFINWNGGSCSVNLTRRTASGSCSDTALAASEAAPLRFVSRPSTGEKRTIQGLVCEVIRDTVAQPPAEYCDADISKTPGGEPLNPYPFATRFYFPGLELQRRDFIANEEAQEVKLNLSVSKDLFKLPGGLDRTGVIQ